jgi:hypothetical protein
MSDIPKEFVPRLPKTIGEEPDPPVRGWAEGGAAPTEADFCPGCGELIEHFNQHAGRIVDGERWHRACHFKKLGYKEIETDEDYSFIYEGVFDCPDTEIEFRTEEQTFEFKPRTKWEYEGSLSENDVSYLKQIASDTWTAGPSNRYNTPRETAAAHILQRVQRQESEEER